MSETRPALKLDIPLKRIPRGDVLRGMRVVIHLDVHDSEEISRHVVAQKDALKRDAP